VLDTLTDRTSLAALLPPAAMFNVAVDWNEEGVSLGSATLPQSAPVTVAELKQQCQKEFQLPPAQQTLATPDGRVLEDGGELLSAATVLLLSEAEEAPPEVHVRWDEQGVALGTAAVAVGAEGGISARDLKRELERRFQVPASSQHLRTVGGQAIDDEETLMAHSEVVMCEQFSITAQIVEYEQQIDTVDVAAASSLSVAELKRRLGESLRLPALQLRLRSTKGITLHDTEMLSGACTVRCSDKLKFVLRVRWVEQEVVLDPKAAKWAGTVTLAETTLRCAGAQPIASLKQKLQGAFGVAVAQQRLGTADGRLLMDGQVVTGEQEILMRVVGEALLVAEPAAAAPSHQGALEPEPEPEPAAVRRGAESMDSVLAAAGLSAYSAAIAEEELSLELLRQLSGEPGALQSSLGELGVPTEECDASAAALVEALQAAAEAARKEGVLTVVGEQPACCFPSVRPYITLPVLYQTNADHTSAALLWWQNRCLGLAKAWRAGSLVRSSRCLGLGPTAACCLLRSACLAACAETVCSAFFQRFSVAWG
jgi:hypothetical protein